MKEQGKTLRICEISPKYQFQGPRFRDLGDASGQEFREDHLIGWLDALGDKESGIIDFGGTKVFSPSFLEESFGGAIRQNQRYREKLTRVSFVNIEDIWHKKLCQYINEA